MFFGTSRDSQKLQRLIFRRIVRQVHKKTTAAGRRDCLVGYLDHILHQAVRPLLSAEEVGIFDDVVFIVPVAVLTHPPHLLLLRELHRRHLKVFAYLVLEEARYYEFLAISEDHAQEGTAPTKGEDEEEDEGEGEVRDNAGVDDCEVTPQQFTEWRLQLLRHFIIYLLDLTRGIEALSQSARKIISQQTYMSPHQCSKTILNLLHECTIVLLRDGTSRRDAWLCRIGPDATRVQQYLRKLQCSLCTQSAHRMSSVLQTVRCSTRACLFCSPYRYRAELRKTGHLTFLDMYEARYATLQNHETRIRETRQSQQLSMLYRGLAKQRPQDVGAHLRVAKVGQN